MQRKGSRKGVMVVLFGIMFVSLMGAAAISIDFARIWVMRNELQTTADAAALAGAVQIGKAPNNLAPDIDAAVTNWAARNKVMGVPVTVDLIQQGTWTDDGTGFRAGLTPTNAVRVVVSHSTSGLIMSNFGITAPTVHSNAIAWSDAPVPTASCIKPWSIPYVVLMSKINTFRGLPNTPANLQRTFDNNLDMAALRSMPDSLRRFTLKQGSQGNNDPTLESGVMPGNFQRIQLPKYYDAATGQYNPYGTSNGTNDYKDAIRGSTCHTLGIGDKLQTLPGNAPEPTTDAMVPTICESITDDKTSPSNGNCNTATGVGVDVKAAFHLCTDGCNGMTLVEVKMLGAFRLEKVFVNSSNKATAWDPDGWDKSEIQGVFKPVDATGSVSSGPTMLTKIILVK